MNYQNILCVGDSQTCGARTYGCYPLYLAQILSKETAYIWRAINLGKNGNTARDLWFQLNQKVFSINDTYQACVLIGANDVGESVAIDLFEEYYRQVLILFAIHRYRAVLCGEIPPIHADGHAFFPRSVIGNRDAYNETITKVVAEFPNAHMVPMHDLGRECYEDPVHFNEKGNRQIARCFVEVIRKL